MLHRATLIFKESLYSLLFPPLCYSCENVLEQQGRLLCDHCASLLELIDPANRCSRCFKICASKRCPHCSQTHHPFAGIAAAFEYLGPSVTLLNKMKYGRVRFLAKTFAACLITQLDRLNWPKPDLIVPVPLSADRQWQRGFNQSALVGQELSQMIDVPMQEVLRQPIGMYSQAGLSHQQRKDQKPQFFLKPGFPIADKIILLVDDVTLTGVTLKECGNALLEGYPHKIYGLTICNT